MADVARWLAVGSGAPGEDGGGAGSGWRCGGWGRGEIAMELGAVLRARDRAQVGSSQGSTRDALGAPASHRLFTMLSHVVGGAAVLGERDDGQEDGVSILDYEADLGYGGQKEEEGGGRGWLENDDIEDF